MNMKKIASSILIALFVLCTANIVSVAEENFKETELNIFLVKKRVMYVTERV